MAVLNEMQLAGAFSAFVGPANRSNAFPFSAVVVVNGDTDDHMVVVVDEGHREVPLWYGPGLGVARWVKLNVRRSEESRPDSSLSGLKRKIADRNTLKLTAVPNLIISLSLVSHQSSSLSIQCELLLLLRSDRISLPGS